MSFTGAVSQLEKHSQSPYKHPHILFKHFHFLHWHSHGLYRHWQPLPALLRPGLGFSWTLEKLQGPLKAAPGFIIILTACTSKLTVFKSTLTTFKSMLTAFKSTLTAV
jgi:hypothetical protein